LALLNILKGRGEAVPAVLRQELCTLQADLGAEGPVSAHLILHRIIEQFGLERPSKFISFQPPCHGQRHLSLDQVAQSPVQPGLEHLQ